MHFFYSQISRTLIRRFVKLELQIERNVKSNRSYGNAVHTGQSSDKAYFLMVYSEELPLKIRGISIAATVAVLQIFPFYLASICATKEGTDFQ